MKGVILAAGYATRFLPASKTIPKEMFPLIDRPVIDFIVQEMVDSGIEDILLVSSRRKKVLEDYFDREVELDSAFSKANSLEKLELIKPTSANIFTLRQQEMMGTGNALMLVEPFVQDAPFVVAYPDDIVMGNPPLTLQLIEAYKETGNTILTVEALPEEDISRYGVIDPVNEGEIMEVRQMVESQIQGLSPVTMRLMVDTCILQKFLMHFVQPIIRMSIKVNSLKRKLLTNWLRKVRFQQ